MVGNWNQTYGDRLKMAWFWIILGLLIVLSSITWILPSARDRQSGERHMRAVRLGMKVRIMKLDSWAEPRLGIHQLSQYCIWSERRPKTGKLWRIADRDESWTAQPESYNSELVPSEFFELLETIPLGILGVGSENGCIWVALDDAKAQIEPEEIRALLDQILGALASD